MVSADKKPHLSEIKRRLLDAIPVDFSLIEDEQIDFQFYIQFTDKKNFTLFENTQEITGGDNKKGFFNFVESKIRMTVAEQAVSKVFLHSGVVSWKNKGILILGRSFSGKTSLVKELIKKGAIYYSDEYAVLDELGFVHPYPMPLSVRGILGKYEQVEISAESFGGKIAEKPCQVGMILITEYNEKAVWPPKMLSQGAGLLELIKHTLPIRLKPKFTLEVLNKITNRAIICQSPRGEAELFAKKILKFFELNT